MQMAGFNLAANFLAPAVLGGKKASTRQILHKKSLGKLQHSPGNLPEDQER